ncbi:monovalent cation/H+ antiporter subunit D family protein [Denitromonas iodatirespirans]|uniref:Monovalent cation/H+ antiporter subunit D family protein n=1 Tax=Denitromonas iodatirespirans TaxID=2795389 RepID=A0A944DCR6_DENI1|nr:monovalent cation/H+ antiporter subunit D family protein [Denitromonas iodatirespirans]MBT0962083.1 monovalent cation/H+ antiporter subunit D family protein [Denitromonas iodatirespirans]
MLTQHFPALLVVVPLIAAPLIVLVRRSLPSWIIALLATAATFGIALSLLDRTLAEGTLSYAMGSWAPPLGIEYRIDAAGAFVAVIVAAMGLIVMPYSRVGIAAEVRNEEHYLYYALMMLCLAGLLGILVTGDAFNVFVFLEVSSLATYVLIAMGRDRRALMAAYQYLLMGTIGATLYVVGVGLLYLETGTLNLADMATRLPMASDSRAVLAALAFITVGISLKIALFPLHLWLPNAYAYAPSPVSAFLAATATKVSIYVLMRYFFSIFGESAVFDARATGAILLGLSLAAMFIPAIVAIFQHDMKRLLAYSSVSQIGYITLGISMDSVDGLMASAMHLFNHALTKGGLFLVLGGVVLRCRGASFDRLAGLGQTMPVAAFAMVVGGLSLIGVPGTAGFISKWYLVSAAIHLGQWWLVGAVLASSLLAVIYVWRFVEVAYFRAPPADHPPPGEAPLSMFVPALLMIGGCVYFGLDATWSSEVATRVAEVLMNSRSGGQ